MKLWLRRGCVSILALAATGCGIFGSSCVDEDGAVLHSSGIVRAGEIATVSVRSPRSSNLILRLQWSASDPRLDLRATITDCGGHVGCAMVTSTPSLQPSSPGVIEMVVDGWVGKTYLVEIVGASSADVAYALDVSYHIACES